MSVEPTGELTHVGFTGLCVSVYGSYQNKQPFPAQTPVGANGRPLTDHRAHTSCACESKKGKTSQCVCVCRKTPVSVAVK